MSDLDQGTSADVAPQRHAPPHGAYGTYGAPSPGLRLDDVRALGAVLAGWRGWYVAALTWNAVVHLSAAVAAGAAAYAVAAAVTGVAGSTRVELMLPTVLVLGATLVRSVAVWQEAYTSHDVAFRVLARVRGWLFAGLARIAPGGVARRRTGDLTTLSTNDSEALEIFLAHSSLYIIGRFLATPLIVVGLALISLPAALVTLPFLALAVLVPLAARRSAREQGRRARAVTAEIGADMQENVGAVREIAAFGLLEERLGRLAGQQTRLWRAQRATTIRTGVETAVGGVLSSLVAVAATVVAVREVAAGRLALEWLPVVAAVAGATPSAIAQWAATTRHYGNTAASARRIEEILDAPDPLPVIPESEGSSPTTSVECLPVAEPSDRGLSTPHIRVESVTYSWPGAPRPAVRDVSVAIGAGETVALAGASGAGKSTLGALLARWYDPDVGRILVGGTDVRAMERAERVATVCLVPQEPYLFAESVRENLAVALPHELPDDALWEALERTRAADVVRGMPHGLDTVLADRGRSLSGGERQRLALARAALRRPEVLILDEAVSQLDVENEVALRDSLIGTATTTVVIAHRLSTLVTTPRVLVLDGGSLVGDGTHEELLAGCDAYRRLVRPQLDLRKGT
ncbi:ABC transporter ATP-binding protein [Ruania alkalisoli]|uniref:ABC transporter ATP-binding protein n=1 Tax=Ruania alkalisoli TaxID=2779775 RepID=A0A7M1SVM7_9MICO|nr:ABC transporter ATP-binding protein [Ruania alkalisoli]QOR70683.1 ABC transporter ATP-binding protein [Ruania alkalisoli]